MLQEDLERITRKCPEIMHSNDDIVHVYENEPARIAVLQHPNIN